VLIKDARSVILRLTLVMHRAASEVEDLSLRPPMRTLDNPVIGRVGGG
jgi:hypothetical protein